MHTIYLQVYFRLPELVNREEWMRENYHMMRTFRNLFKADGREEDSTAAQTYGKTPTMAR
jgi:hypothetical protein